MEAARQHLGLRAGRKLLDPSAPDGPLLPAASWGPLDDVGESTAPCLSILHPTHPPTRRRMQSWEGRAPAALPWSRVPGRPPLGSPSSRAG